MTTSREPCGSVPTDGINVSAYYCHHHQAWTAWVSAHTQTGEDEFSFGDHIRQEFGPFDTVTEVLAWIQQRTVEVVHAVEQARADAQAPR